MAHFDPDTAFDQNEFLRLVQAACDDSLEPADRDRLEAMLRSKADLKHQYVAYLELHAGLQWRFRHGAEFPMAAAQDASAPVPAAGFDLESPGCIPPGDLDCDVKATHATRPAESGGSRIANRPFFTRRRFQFGMAAAAVVIALSLHLNQSPAQQHANVYRTNPIVARVLTQSTATSALPGGFLRSGQTLELESGILQIQLLCGGRASLRGPAKLAFNGPHRCHLAYGALSIDIPQQFCDFVVATPNLVALGQNCEIDIEASLEGRIELHVGRGWIKVNRTDYRGNSIVVESEAAIAVNGDARLREIDFDASRFNSQDDSLRPDLGIQANFSDDDSVGGIDALRNSVAGNGWLTPWQSFRWQNSRLEAAHPLGASEGQHLRLDLRGSAKKPTHFNAHRRYGKHLEVDPSKPHVICWKWRFDGNIDDFKSFDTQMQFFADSEPREHSSSSASWQIGFVPADLDPSDPPRPDGGGDVYKGRWYFFDGGTGSSAFTRENMFDTAMSLRGGVTYHFAVIVNPQNGTYEAQLFDGDRIVSHAGMRFRNGGAGPHTVLHFGGMCIDGDLSSSLDAIEILPYGSIGSRSNALATDNLLDSTNRR